MAASGFEITCINKNPQGRIVRIGGDGWSLSTHEAIHKVLGQQLRLKLLLGNAYVEVGIRNTEDDVYLAIEPEGDALSDLTGIPSC
jgi:hypothetical protein